MLRTLILISAGLVLGFVVAFAAMRMVPSAQNPALVVDEQQLLTAAQIDNLTEYHSFLLSDYDIDYRVVTAANTDDIAINTLETFEVLGVGDQSSTGRGLLLVINTNQDEVRLEVSRALEGVFTDAFVTYIQQRQMVPFFRNSRVADGILATTEMIFAEAQAASATASFDPQQQSTGTTGAGADTSALIGDSVTPPVQQQGQIAAGNSPDTTVAAYLSAMAQRNANPSLDLFTADTQTMLSQWTVTPAQMDNMVRSYSGCDAEPVKINSAGDRAVVRYPPRERECAPWFLESQAGRWRLDLTMLQRAVVFGRSNAWHFDMSVQHPYQFAFADWQFDANGFPR